VDKRLEEAGQPVEADLVLARQGGDEDQVIVAVGDEKRVDEHRLSAE
jgi:hypothetical protein